MLNTKEGQEVAQGDVDSRVHKKDKSKSKGEDSRESQQLVHELEAIRLAELEESRIQQLMNIVNHSICLSSPIFPSRYSCTISFNF